jgi:ferredoxin-NADP reductase
MMVNVDSFRTTVVARDEDAEGVVRVSLRSPEGLLPEWTPGAHVDVFLPDGDVRQYSLTGLSHESTEWALGILIEPDGRGGSRWLAEHAQPGATLEVSYPRNHFAYSPGGDSRKIFVAGGIGITPLLPMIGQATAEGAEWELHYIGRSLDRMAFLRDLAEFGDRVHLYPRDVTDRPDLASLVEGSTPVDVYCCGPELLMEAVEELAHSREFVTAHVERFAPRPIGADRGLDEFEVVFDYSGITAQVGMDQTILDVAEASGIDVPTSCREGTCGTCETPIVSGAVVHLDSVLSDAERETSATMMICISRATCPRLVLDL